MKIKRKISSILILLLTFFVIFAGCIGSAPEENVSGGNLTEGTAPNENVSQVPSNLTYDPFPDTGFRIYCGQRGDDIICTVFFYNAYENGTVTYSESGNNILINIPLAEENASSSEEQLPRPPGYKKYNVSINLGKRNTFENDTLYSVYINSDTDKSGLFILEKDITHVFTPLENVFDLELTSEGQKIRAHLLGEHTSDRVYRIDINNAAVLKSDSEANTFIIFIPLRTTDYNDGGDMNATTLITPCTFDIADAKDLPDGTYKVKIANQEASFDIRDHAVTRISNSTVNRK